MTQITRILTDTRMRRRKRTLEGDSARGILRLTEVRIDKLIYHDDLCQTLDDGEKHHLLQVPISFVSSAKRRISG